MPTYVYRREDGTTFEIHQRITEDALAVCPDTGQPVERVISGNAGLIFKGSGFYLTDYARKSSNGASTGTAAKTESESKPAAKTDTSSAKEAA